MSSNENKNATAAKEPVMVTIEAGKQVEARMLKASDHVKAFDPVIIVITMLASCLGAIIGLELMTRVGVNQNTSIIGALIAVVLSMIPGKVFRRFKNIHAQNLVQTSISGASYAAANAMILPIGIPVLMGRPDLLFPVLIGVTLATIVDGFLIYKVFDSPMFAATNPFPSGIATSETILALANRGKRSLLLFVGMGAGVAGKAIGIPMDLFGVSWFGNVIAMMAFAAGSIVKGSLIPMWTAAISVDGVVPAMITYLPHGMMVGAGMVSLVQAALVLGKKSKKSAEKTAQDTTSERSVTMESMRKSLGLGFVLYIGVAILLAFITGIYTDMGVGQLVVWILFAAFAAIASELICGLSAMHSGWFPAMATALIFLMVGIMMGFPPVALGVLVAYTSATGPAFTDMATDLKCGWILRGRGANLEFEKAGRKQQFISELLGYCVAFVMVLLLANTYFDQGLFVPTTKTFIATIDAGANAEVAKWLLIWAIPGALLQILGGHRQLGILFATGLLIGNTRNGLTVLAALLIRIVATRWKKQKAQDLLYILGAGCIAGSALFSFFSSTLKLAKVRNK